MTTPTGRLERVELREAWQYEDREFTPWLAEEENISLLGHALGIEELRVEATEKLVGKYRADVICRDVTFEPEGRLVLIENQLEQTDHKHLGQIITYASGLGTVTIVWIAKSFTDEHRAALDWLNRVTEDG